MNCACAIPAAPTSRKLYANAESGAKLNSHADGFSIIKLLESTPFPLSVGGRWRLRLRSFSEEATMTRGILNLIFGGVMIVGGLGGRLVLRGTDSGGALAVVGAVFVVLGSTVSTPMPSRGEP